MFITINLKMITIMDGTCDLRIMDGDPLMIRCWHKLTKLICRLALNLNLITLIKSFVHRKYKLRKEQRKLNGFVNFIGTQRMRKSWLNKVKV